MNQNLQQVASLAYSIPVFDRLVRHKLSTLENPPVFARLHRLVRADLAKVVAVDLFRQEVIVGYMAKDGPASRAVIGGRIVHVPR
jgi:hypothetical protein